MDPKLRVVASRGPQLWSQSELAREFCLHHNTVKKRLSPVPPAGTVVSGASGYYLREVASLLLGYQRSQDDPMSGLTPRERLDSYRAERERLKLELEQRQVIPQREVEALLTLACKRIMQMLMTLPDVLERDYALDPLLLQRVQCLVDSAREQLYQDLLLTAAENSQ